MRTHHDNQPNDNWSWEKNTATIEHFRHYAALRHAPGRWCLYADMDEIFVWDEGLPALARRMQAQGATALVAQMLSLIYVKR